MQPNNRTNRNHSNLSLKERLEEFLCQLYGRSFVSDVMHHQVLQTTAGFNIVL